MKIRKKIVESNIDPSSPAKKNWKLRLKRDAPFLIMLIIPTAFFLVFAYLPMYGIIIAFQNFKVGNSFFGGDVQWVGLKWFKMFFSSPYFGRLMRNTIMLTVWSRIILFPVPIILAIVFNEIRRPQVRGIVQTVSYMPYFISVAVVVGMMTSFLNPTSGIVNQLLGFLGIKPIDFMQDPRWFRALFLISDLWETAGFNSIIFIAAISAINPTLYEAAYVDGSSRFKNIIYITIPSIMPTVIIMFIINMGSMLTVGYEKIILMYSPLTYETADVISTFVYRNGISGQKFSYATAIGLFNSVINVIILVLTNKFARKYSETSLW